MPLTRGLIHSRLTFQSLNDNFHRLLKAISDEINSHAPLQTASRKQKRLQKQPWITKEILISINSSDGRLVRASASGAVDCGLIPSRVKLMTSKLIFTASLLDVQH